MCKGKMSRGALQKLMKRNTTSCLLTMIAANIQHFKNLKTVSANCGCIPMLAPIWFEHWITTTGRIFRINYDQYPIYAPYDFRPAVPYRRRAHHLLL